MERGSFFLAKEGDDKWLFLDERIILLAELDEFVQELSHLIKAEFKYITYIPG